MRAKTRLAVAVIAFAHICSVCAQDPVTIGDAEVITTVRTPEIVINGCQVEITLEYFQRGALAHVEGEIQNRICPASSGTFVVSVRTLNANGESITQEFPETWENIDGQPQTFNAEYAIGDNVDLTRVRTLRARCRCLTPDSPE